MDAARERLGGLISAEVVEQQHGDGSFPRGRFCCWDLFGCDSRLFRPGLQDVVVDEHESDSQRQQSDDREIEFAPGLLGDRLRGIHVRFALDPLRRQLERPGEDQHKRQANR